MLDVQPWATPLVLGWLYADAFWQKRVAIFEQWHKKVGFNIVALGFDTMHCFVAKPPSTVKSIADRMVEALAVCSDYPDDSLAGRLTMVLGQQWTFRFDV